MIDTPWIRAARPSIRDPEIVRSSAMRSKPETFEEHAVQCEQLAARTIRRDLRLMYRDMARQWREMAGHVRSIEQLDATVAARWFRSEPTP